MEKATGIKRIVNAYGYSVKGIVATVREEAAFRQELILAAVLIPVACLLDVSRIDRVLMIASLLLVLVVELVNSAIESAINRIGTDHHELSGRAKDQGSAAVLIALLIAGVIWISALWSLIFG